MRAAERQRLEDSFAAERRKRGERCLDEGRVTLVHAAQDLRRAGAETAAEQIERGVACCDFAAASLAEPAVPTNEEVAR